MKFQIPKGSSSVILTVFIQDSSVTTGAGLGSLDQTSSITGGYVKRNGTGVALAVDQNVTTEGTYEAPSTAAQVRIGTPANMITGVYELHFHNDLFTTADWVTVTLGGASNMAPLALEIQLTSIDLNDAVRGGMSALPNAAPNAAGGSLISATGSLDMDTLLGTLTTLAAETRSANLLDQLKTIIAVIESQRGDHTHQPGTGSILFVDGTNGATHASGARGGISDPYLSIQDAHDNAGTDYGHDLYILVAGASGATSAYSENVDISDGYAFFRGPGRDLSQKPTANNTVAFTVSGDGVELSGFQLDDFDGTGAQHGIQITDSDFAFIHNIWFNQTRGDGINILRGTFCLICDNNFEGTGVEANGQGVHVTGTGPGVASENRICRNHMSNTGGDSILVENGTTNDTAIYDNTIHDSVGWAINIGGSSTDALIHNNMFGNNASGNITDAGTTTIDVNNVPWLYSTVINRSLDVTLTGAAGLDWGNMENKGATVDLSETVIKLCDTVTTNTDVRGTDSAALASVWTAARAGALTDWINGGRLDLLLDAIKAKTDSLNFTGNDVKATLDSETVALSASERNALADALLLRDVSNVEATAGDHSLCYVVLAMSESDTTTNANKLTVFKTDGTTEFVQKTITTDAAADPLTKVE